LYPSFGLRPLNQLEGFPLPVSFAVAVVPHDVSKLTQTASWTYISLLWAAKDVEPIFAVSTSLSFSTFSQHHNFHFVSFSHHVAFFRGEKQHPRRPQLPGHR
jgi:hypothetical protein